MIVAGGGAVMIRASNYILFAHAGNRIKCSVTERHESARNCDEGFRRE